MSDVILYAALKENQKLNTELLNLCLGTSTSSIADYLEGVIETGAPYGGVSATSNVCIPAIVSDWQTNLTPFAESRANGLKICDTSGYYRCGNNCSWTVPGGVTNVQFQLWGPGSGTSGQCCCGGSPFGASGAYAVVQMDVTAGDVYTLCSGCAYCCCAQQTTPGICGGPTYVSGPGLCICADSGISCYCHWAVDINAPGLGDGSCGVPTFDGCGPNSCSGYNFCWDSSNDDIQLDHAFSRQTWATSCKNENCNIVAYGINGMWPAITIGGSLDSGSFGISSPIFGFESMTCCAPWNGNTCHGQCMQAQSGIQQGPGFGGFADRKHGGCNACGGDHGGMGMVCVSWT